MNSPATDYKDFVRSKGQSGAPAGFAPTFLPPCMIDFQAHLTGWAVRQGRGALFADCGLGKSLMELVWGQNVVRQTNGRVLILTPLAVAPQFVSEGEKFCVPCVRSQDGKVGGPGIYVANYQRLQHFDPTGFAGVVCDESSILKNYNGKTRQLLTRFLSKVPYRLMATATPAPNDYVELGTTSEALGELTHSDMLRRFFQQLDDKGQKRELRKQQEADALIARDPSYYKKLAYRVSQTIGQWRLKHHAVAHFWRWVASWARACRMPSDLGFADGPFVLPPLDVRDHVIAAPPPPGCLYTMPAVGMYEERQERKRTLKERCQYVAELVDHPRSAVVWCHTNDEADLLERTIPGARQIAGRTPDARKEELYSAFASQQLRVLVIKPKIGAWGLNWQHCAHVVTFPTHSYESYKQLICRCQRFGQKERVRVDVVATEGEVRVLENMRAKARRAEAMFAAVVREMVGATRIEREDPYTGRMEVPGWLS
jgi:hypothetical protein